LEICKGTSEPIQGRRKLGESCSSIFTCW